MGENEPSEKQPSLAESMILGEQMRQYVDGVAKELEGLPATHPARVNYDLDLAVVRENTHFGSSYEVEEAVGLIRALEAKRRMESPAPESITEAANAVVFEDLESAVRESHYRDRGGELGLVGTGMTPAQFQAKVKGEMADMELRRLARDAKRQKAAEGTAATFAKRPDGANEKRWRR